MLRAFFYKAIITTNATTAALKNDVEAALPTDSLSMFISMVNYKVRELLHRNYSRFSRLPIRWRFLRGNPQFASLA
jgi:hypothetical protein